MGEIRVDVSRDRLWAALNDPAMLARCAESAALGHRAAANFRPAAAPFTGTLTLTGAEGGGDARVPGATELALAAENGGTRLRWAARDDGGSSDHAARILAALGTELEAETGPAAVLEALALEPAALSAAAVEPVARPDPSWTAPPGVARSGGGLPLALWAGLLAAAVLALLAYLLA